MSGSVVRSSVGSVSWASSTPSQLSSYQTSQQHEKWVTAFLAEMASALPYKRPRCLTAAATSLSKKRCHLDWESLLSDMHRLMGRFLSQADRKKCREVSRAWRRAFSWDVQGLILRDVTSKQLTASLTHAFRNVIDVKVTSLRGRLEPDLQLCASLKKLWLEPLHSGGRDADRLAIVGRLTNLEELHLWGPVGCTSRGIQHLQSLTKLTSLSLGTKLLMEGKDWKHLEGCTELKQLELIGCCAIDDIGLAFLATMREMVQLKLSVAWDGRCDLRGQGMHSLGRMMSLKCLEWRNASAMTSCHFRHLMQLTRLTSLKLTLCSGASDDLVVPSGLENLGQLVHLSLCNVPCIRDDVVQALTQLCSIRSLHLGECTEMTNDAATAVADLPNLTQLKLDKYPCLALQGLDVLISTPSLKALKVTGIYSITGDELYEFASNNHLVYDTLAWKQQILLLQDIH